MERTTIRLDGLRDESSAEQVSRALQEVWGIRSVDQVSVARGEVTFTYDEKAASVGDFQEALRECGFVVSGGEGNA